MTQQGAPTPSTFNARADRGAQALRAQLNAQGRQMPETAPVVVDANGRPPAPLPPEGSYARQAIEQQRRAGELIGDQPPAGTPAQAMDGSVAPPLPMSASTPQAPAEEPASPRAERRIQELIQQLRAKDEQLQNLENNSKLTLQQQQERYAALENQHRTMLQANLEHLDPETRAAVMQDARIAERIDALEGKLLARIQPQLQNLQTKAQRDEMAALANKYPGFDYQIHAPLIDMFRAKNPACTIDQAFRAVAKEDELVTRSAASAAAVPPVVPPGNGSVANSRYAPSPEPKSDPEAELREEARRVKDLRMSTDPAQQKEGLRLAHENLKKRLFGPR